MQQILHFNTNSNLFSGNSKFFTQFFFFLERNQNGSKKANTITIPD